ncbi:hypothetical protein OH492_10985 [Vibrio chagasii]|nr:hypothetical protein [Vibrio chagasii]
MTGRTGFSGVTLLASLETEQPVPPSPEQDATPTPVVLESGKSSIRLLFINNVTLLFMFQREAKKFAWLTDRTRSSRKVMLICLQAHIGHR